MPVSSKNRRAFSVAPLIILHLLIVLPLAYFLNIWADEGSTLYTTQHGFWAAFQNAATDEKQAPLYFWLMSLWRSIDGSIFFARLFSVICSLVAIKMFAGLARRVFTPRAAFLATAFLALHPFLIWASLEIRVYSLVVLLSIILLRLFVDGFLLESSMAAQRNARILFLVAAVISLYTNYYLGFLFVGFLAALLISKKWHEAGIYCGLMTIAAIAFVPQVLVVRSQFSVNTSGSHEPRSLLEGVRGLWHQLLTFILPAEVLPGIDASPADVIRVWSVRAGLAVITIFGVKRYKTISRQTVTIGAVFFAILVCLLAAYFAIGIRYVQVRHASVIFVPLILFATSLLSDIFGKERGRASIADKIIAFAGAMLVVVSFSYALVTLYPNMAKRGDWARVGAFIQENESPGQPIIVFTTYDALSLPYHYHGINKVLPDERFFEFESEATFGTERLTRETDFVISKIPADAEELWLVVSEKCLVTDACVPLENYIRANYTIEKEQEFYLEKVYFLKKK
jgi:hypothetical protein